jgi:PPP family 3-phenylpropionic acid transporter
MTKLHGYGHNRSSLIRVSLLQGLFFLAFGAGIPFFSLYFKHMLTFSNGEPAYHLIGLLFFIQPLFGIVATPLAGLVSDRFKIESRLLCMCSLMVSVGAILISLPGFQNYTHWHLQKRYVFILIGILLNGLFQRPIIPLIDTETLQYLHEAFGSGDRYGQLRMAGSFGWILSTSLFGWILYVSGRLNLAFIGYGAGFMVLALVTSRGFRTKIRPARIQWDHLKNDAVFHRFLIYLFFHSLGLSSSFHFTSYFMDDARAGYFIIGLSFGLSALPEIPIMNCTLLQELVVSSGHFASRHWVWPSF